MYVKIVQSPLAYVHHTTYSTVGVHSVDKLYWSFAMVGPKSPAPLNTAFKLARNLKQTQPATFKLRGFAINSALRRKDHKMSNGPPKHEMVYLKGLASEVRQFGEFRKVLHTGLYSQLVAMEVPVGGEIGDEVRINQHTPHAQSSPA
jgi:hypothetical protein